MMLTEILRQNPADTFARYGLAMALADDAPDAALEQYDRLVTEVPDYVPAYQMSGQLLIRLGRIADARTRIEQGLAAARRTSNSHAASELATELENLVSP